MLLSTLVLLTGADTGADMGFYRQRPRGGAADSDHGSVPVNPKRQCSDMPEHHAMLPAFCPVNQPWCRCSATQCLPVQAGRGQVP